MEENIERRAYRSLTDSEIFLNELDTQAVQGGGVHVDDRADFLSWLLEKSLTEELKVSQHATDALKRHAKLPTDCRVESVYVLKRNLEFVLVDETEDFPVLLIAGATIVAYRVSDGAFGLFIADGKNSTLETILTF